MKNKIRHLFISSSLFALLFLLPQCDRKEEDEHPERVVDTISVQEKDSLVWVYNPADGWLSSIPSEQGIDSTVLIKAHMYIQNKSGYHSFLVIKNGYLVFEKYYSGFDKERLNNLKSATKSITSILVGIALKKNLIGGIDQPLEKIFPEYFTKETDSSKRKITLKHLLTMTAGLKWNNFGGSLRNRWWSHKDNPHKYAINAPELIHTPGEVFNYNSVLSHLLTAIIVKKSCMTLLEFANKNLFSPLGISEIRWDTDKTGLHRGHSELWMTSRNMAKIGYLYLCNGYWYDKQIVSKKWVQESLEPYIDHRLYRCLGKVWELWLSVVVKDYKRHPCLFCCGVRRAIYFYHT